MTSNGRRKTEVLERNVVNANIASGVEIFADEQHLFHILLRRRLNDPVKKEYVDQDNVQSFSATDFAQMQATDFFKEYDTVEVLHDPTKVDELDPESFYKKKGKGKSAAQAQFDRDKEEADTILANAENAKAKQVATETKAAEAPIAAAASSIHVPMPSDPNANKSADEVRKDTKEVKKSLKQWQKEYKDLYEADAPDGATIEELAELVNAKNTEKK